MADQFTTADDRELHDLFDSPDYDPNGIGLALSGGGYKAAAYHLGSLIRLNELGFLPRLARITSVSGGSIAAGMLGYKWNSLDFDPNTGVARNFGEMFVEPLKDFLTEVNLDVTQGLLGILLPFRSAADGVAHGYDRHLFHDATLQDLPDEVPGKAPRFVILATNYELNSLWRFAKPYAADYRVGKIEHPRLSLARVVAASSAFPPFFCPIEIDLSHEQLLPLPGADKHGGDYLKRALLADGGVYDNMGLEPIVKRYGTLLVSNAGGVFEEDSHPSNWFGLLTRIINMIHRQAENNRQRPLMLLARAGRRKIAYWPLRNDNSNYPTPSTARLPQADIDAAQAENVRLCSLGAKTFARLVNHGYSLCDSAIGSYIEDIPHPKTAQLPFR